jgi:protein involved in polysaccharide export with SLBB domain
MTDRTPPAQHRAVTEGYWVGCPDEIELHIEQRPEFDGRQFIGPDGCIELGRYGKVRIEGLTLRETADRVAARLACTPDRVQVRVVEFASRHLLLIGEVVGRHRTIPYQGDETVLDVLQRVGGITPGAEPTEVYVIRSHLGDLHRPEVFHVDLEAIVMHKDQKTNVRVLPYDEIYVGETRQARVEKCIPPWLRPVYQSVWDMLPSSKAPQEQQHGFTDWIRGWFASDEAAPQAAAP